MVESALPKKFFSDKILALNGFIPKRNVISDGRPSPCLYIDYRLTVNLILISLYGERVFHGYLKGYGYQFIVQPLACCVCSSLFKVCLCNSRNFTFSTSTFWVSTSLDTYHRCFSMSNFAFKMAYVKLTEVQMSYRRIIST